MLILIILTVAIEVEHEARESLDPAVAIIYQYRKPILALR
jgi:hypothetical protein